MATLEMAGSLREEPRGGVPHDRELSITWSDGARWQLRLDQGFGFLQPIPGRRIMTSTAPRAARL